MTIEQSILHDLDLLRASLDSIERVVCMPDRQPQDRQSMLLHMSNVRDLVLFLTPKLSYELR